MPAKSAISIHQGQDKAELRVASYNADVANGDRQTTQLPNKIDLDLPTQRQTHPTGRTGLG